MPVALDVEIARLGVVELDEVQRGQVAGSVVQEHVLTAWVTCIDAAVGGACVPLVNSRVELQARVGAGPGRVADLLP